MDFTKDSVTIRNKKLSNGNLSLYLDIYSSGIRKYEFLKLYLVPESNKKSKQHNKEVLWFAEKKRIQKLADISKTPLHEDRKVVRLCWFMEKCIAKKAAGTSKVYENVLRLVKMFFGNDFVIEDLNEEYIRKFFEFIGTVPNRNKPGKTLCMSTRHLYCSVFNAVLKQAADDGLMPYDVSKRIKIVPNEDTERQYLTIEELQLLAKTRLVKSYRRAFLFSCFTGLRASDIERLYWSEVMEQDGFTRIVFRQKKTRKVEYLDISQQAREMMGIRRDDDEKVFPKFHCTSMLNRTLRNWIKSVGITKHISFHCARHTFAVMMMTIGTDIYTTSKLLGHKKLETTQIYAKIVDKKKQEAVQKIPIIL